MGLPSIPLLHFLYKLNCSQYELLAILYEHVSWLMVDCTVARGETFIIVVKKRTGSSVSQIDFSFVVHVFHLIGIIS